MKKIRIFDSTLRDGAQSEGVSYSVQDKLNITKALDSFGVSFIEAGIPASNPKDLEFFPKAKQLNLKNAQLCAFGRTRLKGVLPENDENLNALINAETDAVSIFGKAWDMHVTKILGISLEDNIKMVRDSIEYLKAAGKFVIFDAEHFFDGYKNNREYALSVLEAAKNSDMIALCDTNGGFLPDEIYSITKEITDAFADIDFAIHAHNDSGCAAANSVMAVKAGAVSVQGTFTGYGERTGNAELSTVIPNLILKCGLECDGNLDLLTKTAMIIAEISNTHIDKRRPYIGRSAFAHKGGMHIDAVKKTAKAYEHIDPVVVGNKRRFLTSEMSGRSTVLDKIHEFAPMTDKNSDMAKKITAKLKELEHLGYQFEAADASFELMVKRTMGLFKPHFETVLYKTIGEFPTLDGGVQASAVIHIRVDGQDEITAAMGNGPVNALDTAIRKALSVFYPQLKSVKLTDYKVRVFDTQKATGATTRVLIESTDGTDTWTTVGASSDIIEASWFALVDSIEYKLSKK